MFLTEPFIEDDKDENDNEKKQAQKEIETFSKQFKESLKKEKGRLQKNIDKMIGSNFDLQDVNQGESFDQSDYQLSQVKDEKGRTILHLAVSKYQKPSILYQMLKSAEYLIAERDEKYQTIKNVAINTNNKSNAQVIDNYILNAFQKNKTSFIKRLSQQGYDFSDITDSNGSHISSIFEKIPDKSMFNLFQNIIRFQKLTHKLHTFVKNEYIQGIKRLVESDVDLVIAKSCKSRTSLHLAMLFGNIEIVQYLIQANPSVINIQDNVSLVI